MMVLYTILVFLATGSPSASPGDLELVLLLLSIFLNFDLKQLTLAFWTIEKVKQAKWIQSRIKDLERNLWRAKRG